MPMVVFTGVDDGTFVLHSGERRNAAGVLAAGGDGGLLMGCSADTEDDLGDGAHGLAARGRVTAAMACTRTRSRPRSAGSGG